MVLEFTDDLHEKIRAEIQNVETALDNLKEAEERQEKSVIESQCMLASISTVIN
jgi:hypothetical protein